MILFFMINEKDNDLTDKTGEKAPEVSRALPSPPLNHDPEHHVSPSSNGRGAAERTGFVQP